MIKLNYGYALANDDCLVGRKAFGTILDRFRATNERETKLLLLIGRDTKAKEVENWVREKLIRLGIPLNLEGYNYLLTGILLSYHDNSLLKRVTKSLYPSIAKKYLTNQACVERNMRSAIEQSTRLGYFNEMYDFELAGQFYKPANKLFISLLLTKLQAQFGAYQG